MIIYRFQNLTKMEFLILLVKILLQVEDLNIADKPPYRASRNIQYMDFQKSSVAWWEEIDFRSISLVLISHTPPFSSRVLIYYPFPDSRYHYSVNLALHTKQNHSRQPTRCSLLHQTS